MIEVKKKKKEKRDWAGSVFKSACEMRASGRELISSLNYDDLIKTHNWHLLQQQPGWPGTQAKPRTSFLLSYFLVVNKKGLGR